MLRHFLMVALMAFFASIILRLVIRNASVLAEATGVLRPDIVDDPDNPGQGVITQMGAQ